MAKKLIVSERQLVIIAKHINEHNDGVIEEGFKEIALSLLMLAGVTLTGQNKLIAQESLTNSEIIQQVDNVLADSNKLENVISRIEKTMPNAGEKIQQNAERIKATVNYIEDKNKRKDKVSKDVEKTTVTSPSRLKAKLSQGFALTGINIKRDTILPQDSIVVIQDTINYNWSSDNFFITGGFDMNNVAADSILSVVSDIKSANGKVIGVFIESSTDREPIKMGNEKLAKLRANSVEQYMKGLDLGEAKFNISTKPNGGPDIYTKGMSKGERVTARIKSAPFRYVNIKLVVVFEEKVKEGETAPQVVERHEYELTRIYTHSNEVVKVKYNQTETKSKCKKVLITTKTGKTKIAGCSFEK